MFKVVLTGWSAEKYIDKCLESLFSQTYHNWEAQLILDPSEDTSYMKAAKWCGSKLNVCLNGSRKLALNNVVNAINLLSPHDEDVIVLIDADDWLSGIDSLDIINSYYEKYSNLQVTHGSWLPYPNEYADTNNEPYTKVDFDNNFRKLPWRASHLKTFKYKIWKQIKNEDLRDELGNYIRYAWDLAIMWPLLELSGFDRVKFIPEKVYVYNQENVNSVSFTNVKEQRECAEYISNKTPYKILL